MIILSTIRCGEEAYDSASQAILKKLEPTHNRGLKLAFELFVICRTENVLSEAGLPTLSEMRDLNNVKTTMGIITNPRHSIRPFCVELKKTDEYAYKPTTPKPLFVGASDSFRNLQIDPRRIKKTPQYIRPLWININNQQYDFEVCTIGRRTSNERLCKETARILEERYSHHTKIYTDGSKKEERVGYAVIWNDQKIKKRVRLQNTITAPNNRQS
jgi:hypothetical protein